MNLPRSRSSLVVANNALPIIPMSAQRYAIGIDIGGTRIKFGRFDVATGVMLEKFTEATMDGEFLRGEPAWKQTIRDCIISMMVKHGKPIAIGIAAPGLAAKDNSCIACMSGRLEGLAGLNWSQWLNYPTAVINDAHAALLGEVWQGAATNRQDVVMLTLGTGVGGGILLNGKLHQGAIGRAGHLGHLTVDADGPRTIVGMPGGLDVIMGNATIAERSNGRFTSTAALTAAVQAGDEIALQIWDRSIHQLACGIGSLIHVIDPEVVLIGGGIAEVGSLLFDRLEHALAQVEWRPLGTAVPILPAQLGEWAGTYGAAHFAIQC
jgi:glucokinase